MKASTPLFQGEAGFVVLQAITRRIFFLEDRMKEAWEAKDTHKLQHDARQVALLWDAHDKIQYIWGHGKWPEEKS
jgi:hypothetical protein